MIEQVFTLQSDDNLITLSDQINAFADQSQGATEKRVVLVLPPDATLLRRRVELLRLVRQARRRKVDLALVTQDYQVHEQARALRVPVFTSLTRAQGRRWRWPWERMPGPFDTRARRPGFLRDKPGDMHEVRRRRARHARLVWIGRILGALFFIGVLGLIGSLTYLVAPAARITLVPASEAVHVVTAVVAVPGLESIDYADKQIPARQLRVTVDGSASISTTGLRDVPDQHASGSVLFTSVLPQNITVPEGTTVRTTAGVPVRFVTTEAVVVPGLGQATAPIDALDPGFGGNVDEGLINRVDGSLAVALRVINPGATDGGTTRQTPAVSQTDRDTLRQILLKELLRQATVDMGAQASENEFVATDSLRIVQVEDETYDRFVGEEANLLAMDMTVSVEGVVVNEQSAHTLVYNALARQGGGGYELLASSLRFRRGEVTEVDGRGAVTFYMQGWGARIPRLDLEAVKRDVRGRTLADAVNYLNSSLPLAAEPEIALWPEKFERMPYLVFRIETDVVIESSVVAGP